MKRQFTKKGQHDQRVSWFNYLSHGVINIFEENELWDDVCKEHTALPWLVSYVVYLGTNPEEAIARSQLRISKAE